MSPAQHREVEPSWVSPVALVVGGLLVAAMIVVAVLAAMRGNWLTVTFAVVMVALVSWDEWMRRRG